MSIPSTLTRVNAATDGATKIFPVNIQAYAATDFLAILVNNATGAAATLVLGADYSMAPATADIPPKWNLTTLPALAYPAGSTLLTILNPVQTHPTVYPGNSPFPTSSVQTDIDRLTQMVLRLQDQISRSLVAPDGDINPLVALPSASARRGQFVGFDAILGNLALSTPATQAVYGTAVGDTFVAAAGQTVFALSQNPANANNIALSVDGAVLVPGLDFTWTAPGTITLAVGALVGQTVYARYMQGLAAPISQASAAASSGWGAPGGAAVINNFNSATATALQVAQAVAQIIKDLIAFQLEHA